MSEFTLAQLAERVAPRSWRARRAMLDIVKGRAEVSESRARRIDRVVEPLVEPYRAKFLANYPDHHEWHALVYARSAALVDAFEPVRARYRRRADRLGEEIRAKVHKALTSAHVQVSASHDGLNRRRLVRAELEVAKIDLDRGTLTIAGITWEYVDIELPKPAQNALHDVAQPNEANAKSGLAKLLPNRGPTMVDKVANWLKTDGSQWRNASNKGIAERFKSVSGSYVSEETIRQARKRLGLPPRTKKRAMSGADSPTAIRQ